MQTLVEYKQTRNYWQDYVDEIEKNSPKHDLGGAQVRQYLESALKPSVVEQCFWELFSAFPRHLPLFLRLRTHTHRVYEDFLFTLIRAFCSKKTQSRTLDMMLIYIHVDVRIERVLFDSVPLPNIAGLFAGKDIRRSERHRQPSNIFYTPQGSTYEATRSFSDYDDQFSVYFKESVNLRLTGGAILLQLSMGKKSAGWEGFNKRARNFQSTTNSDVSGVYERIKLFILPKKPSKPLGWYSFPFKGHPSFFHDHFYRKKTSDKSERSKMEEYARSKELAIWNQFKHLEPYPV